MDETCRCALCFDVREATERAEDCRKNTRGHRIGCACWLCQTKQDALVERRMMTAKRDLYSELSFLTSGHKLGTNFLAWVYGKITDEKFQCPQWWADRAPHIPLKKWMDEWHAANLPKEVLAVSGLY